MKGKPKSEPAKEGDGKLFPKMVDQVSAGFKKAKDGFVSTFLVTSPEQKIKDTMDEAGKFKSGVSWTIHKVPSEEASEQIEKLKGN